MSEANDTRQMQPPGFNGKNKVLLHSCCAPCSAAVMEAIKVMGVDLTVFFYNPNIHPFKEYERRKNENKRFAEKLNIPFIDADYDSTRWFEQTNGLENEPERGARCTVCFDMRLTNTAQYANAHDFPIFAASLGISRWKNLELINDCGQRAAARYPALFYWDCNWRKGGGTR